MSKQSRIAMVTRLMTQSFGDESKSATFTDKISTGRNSFDEISKTADNVIRLMFTDFEVKNKQIKSTDIKLRVLTSQLSAKPTPDRTQVTFDDVLYDIKDVWTDNSNAAYTVQARPL